MMKNRTRPARIEFRVTEQERQLIQKKMDQLGTKNMGAYLRKMATSSRWITPSRKSWPLPSAEQPPTSTTSAAGSTRPAIAMRMM